MFKAMQGCARSAGEQRYIYDMLAIWKKLPAARQEEVRRLIGEIAQTPLEGRALFDVLVRGISMQAEAARTGVQISRLYKMRREFYERYRL